MPTPGQILPNPIIGYSTKLEAGDRTLTLEEAEYISGLGPEQFAEIDSLARQVNDAITQQAERTGFTHYDGKVEMAFRKDPSRNNLLLIAAAGTFDEDRLGIEMDGEFVQVSKEVLRQWYKVHQPRLAEECERLKPHITEN
jgi:phosphoribosylaminoimidazole-succinocarboxamide synthase